MPSNNEFLSALFGDDLPWVHVTDFAYDPAHIPPDRHLAAWKGDYFSRYRMGHGTNQYFTISTFYADEKGTARRRKALYRTTPVIVLDDVREKLSITQVAKLPQPTWILETSPGSEQWGYKLDVACTDRSKIENLLDGLVANGLAPEGRDPGMKGVTRYVRLPDGYNTKKSKMVEGRPFKCNLLRWAPIITVTLEQLAAPFAVDLNAARRETRTDGAATVADHPLLSIPDIIHIKHERSGGRFDITCPWVDEHTGFDDSGTAIFTNADGSIGFKCHHGVCQDRTGRNLLEFIAETVPGFNATLKSWQLTRAFSQVSPTQIPSFLEPVRSEAPLYITPLPEEEPLTKYFNQLRTMVPYTQEAREMASKLLQVVDGLSTIDRTHWHNEIRDTMHWTKPELKDILNDLRTEWYSAVAAGKAINFFDEVIFVRELNQFFDRQKRLFYTAEAYQNSYADLDPEVRKQALQGGMVSKVDRLDYAPLQLPIFTEGGVTYGNSWSAGSEIAGVQGDIDRYMMHFDKLDWAEYRDHIMKWMAYTIRHPDRKINHMLMFGSAEGCGKDWLLYPLVLAMGENHTTIDGEELLGGFQDYALSTKHLHINEAELGDRKEALAVSNKLKPLAAAPPDKLRVNQKNIKPIKIRNVLSLTMTTNSRLPLRLNSASRRIYAVWSDLNVRDERDEMTPEWRAYWEDRWHWMKNGGAEAVIYYLRHNVDLSQFNPGQAPPMTEFLRSIRDASKSPMMQTVEAFIARRVGCFASDLLTVNDMIETLRAGAILHNDILYCDHKAFTPSRVGCMLRESSGFAVMRGRSTGVDLSIWAVRTPNAYKHMSPSELVFEYERQMHLAKTNIKSALTVVR